jgi:hypothetical protein
MTKEVRMLTRHATKYLTMLTLILIIFVSTFTISFRTSAATASDFSSANSAIKSAFSAISNAQQQGGNVSALVTKINVAIELVQKAQTENSTNPAQATADLQNATLLAQQVSSSAPKIGNAGLMAREIQYSESVGAALVIVILAVVVYIYGARIYHLIWFYLYKNHGVKTS